MGDDSQPEAARPKARRRKYQGIRRGIQIAVAAYVLLISVGHTAAWPWAANVHTICPFGGVANLYTYFSTGNYVAKLHSAVFVMLIALVLGLLLTGKSFCGWICPLGTVQELLGRLGRRLWPRAYDKVPRSAERVLQLVKYGLLVWILVQTARTGKLFFEGFDPYYNLFNIWSDTIAWTGYLAVALTVVASLFVERPFCRYACPLGGLNGLFNSFSLYQIRRDGNTCIDCGRCDKACPAHVKVSEHDAVRNVECMRCLRCVEACPVNSKTGSTLALRTVFEKAPLVRRPTTSSAFMSVAVLAFVLPIALTMATGNFLITATHVYTSPTDIKGSSTVEDILTNFDVPQEVFYNAFGIPESVKPTTLLKDLQSAMGISSSEEIVVPENIRIIITYMGSTLDAFKDGARLDGTRLNEVQTAAGLSGASTLRELMERGRPGAAVYVLSGAWPDDAMSGDADTTTTSGPPKTTATSVGGQPSSSTGTSTLATSTTQEIKGTTTLGEMRSKVKDFTAFLAAFSIPTSEPDSATLKDLAATYGFEVTAVRTYVAEHQ
jgi:polyferredoxin